MAKIQKIKISQQQQNNHKKSTLINKTMNLFDVFADIDEFFNGDCQLLDNPTEYKLVKDCENEYLKLTDDNYDDVDLLQFWNNCNDTDRIIWI